MCFVINFVIFLIEVKGNVFLLWKKFNKVKLFLSDYLVFFRNGVIMEI